MSWIVQNIKAVNLNNISEVTLIEGTKEVVFFENGTGSAIRMEYSVVTMDELLKEYKEELKILLRSKRKILLENCKKYLELENLLFSNLIKGAEPYLIEQIAEFGDTGKGKKQLGVLIYSANLDFLSDHAYDIFDDEEVM